MNQRTLENVSRTHLIDLLSGSEKADFPWKTSDEGVEDATSPRTLGAHLFRSQTKSKLRLRSTPGEEVDDAGLRFFRQQLDKQLIAIIPSPRWHNNPKGLTY